MTAARIDLRLGQSSEDAEDVHNWTIESNPCTAGHNSSRRARLGPAASVRLAQLAAAAADDDAEETDPPALALIKSVPGNVSLESMLTEIGKLHAVRAAGLPDGVFAGMAPKVNWRARAASAATAS